MSDNVFLKRQITGRYLKQQPKLIPFKVFLKLCFRGFMPSSVGVMESACSTFYVTCRAMKYLTSNSMQQVRQLTKMSQALVIA